MRLVGTKVVARRLVGTKVEARWLVGTCRPGWRDMVASADGRREKPQIVAGMSFHGRKTTGICVVEIGGLNLSLSLGSGLDRRIICLWHNCSNRQAGVGGK